MTIRCITARAVVAILHPVHLMATVVIGTMWAASAMTFYHDFHRSAAVSIGALPAITMTIWLLARVFCWGQRTTEECARDCAAEEGKP